ncbi:hypothetical protein ACPCXE_20040, partial [Bacillus velezensis]|uniref:hypothetical protein n=1 Tax=Bacillus velezensis TaxID=492670 RepID=UPI003C26A58F
HGQLGRGAVSPPSQVPAPVLALAGVSAVALAGDTSCAVAAHGVVHCLGDNIYRHADPSGPLRSDHALPVDPARVRWTDAP